MKEMECYACGGLGPCIECAGTGVQFNTEDCGYCLGDGICAECRGTGIIEVEHE